MLNLDKLTESARPALTSGWLRHIPRVVRFLVLLVAVGLLLQAGISALVANWLTGKLDVQGVDSNLVTAVGLMAFSVTYRLFWRMFKPGLDGSRARAQYFLMLCCVISMGSIVSQWNSSRDGSARRYYCITPDGVYYSKDPGEHPVYQLPLKPVTPDVRVMLDILEKRRFFRVDPSRSTWFHPNSGDPVLWYTRGYNSELLFFSRYGRNPDNGEELRAVTAELRAEWNAKQPPRKGSRR